MGEFGLGLGYGVEYELGLCMNYVYGLEFALGMGLG